MTIQQTGVWGEWIDGYVASLLAVGRPASTITLRRELRAAVNAAAAAER